MFHLGYKTLVLNDASLVNISGSIMSIPGFGAINNLDQAYTKNTTPGLAPTISTTDMAGITAPVEVAIYWQSLRYIGEGLGNMSTPQDPTVIMVPTGLTFAEAFALWEEDFGTSELFYMDGDILTAKNIAVSMIEVYTRPINLPTDPAFTSGTGFKYNNFTGTIYGTPSVQGTEGIATGKLVEESIRHSIGTNVDPYSIIPNGSEVVELDAIYDVYDFTVQNFNPDGFLIPENLAQHTPDENVVNNPIKLTIYAKQGAGFASEIIAGFSPVVDFPLLFTWRSEDSPDPILSGELVQEPTASYYLYCSIFNTDGDNVESQLAALDGGPATLTEVGSVPLNTLSMLPSALVYVAPDNDFPDSATISDFNDNNLSWSEGLPTLGAQVELTAG